MQLKAIRSSWREEWNPFSFEEVSAVGGEIGVDGERTRKVSFQPGQAKMRFRGKG